MTYYLTSDAQQDIIFIRRYTLKQWGITQSAKYIQKLRETLILLTKYPNLGKPIYDLPKKVYGYPCQKHIIYYFFHQQKLFIFAILHQYTSALPHLMNRLNNET